MDYKERHREARILPRAGYERALNNTLKGWIEYAESARSAAGRDDFEMHDDYVLGDHWAEIGYALRRLLDGETGRFDCGTFLDEITHTLTGNGYSAEDQCKLRYTIGYPADEIAAPDGVKRYHLVYTSAGNGWKEQRDDAVRMLGAFIGNNPPDKLAMVFHGAKPEDFKVIRVNVWEHTEDPAGTIQEDLSNV